MTKKYQLLDSGNQQKLEQFGPCRIIRPCGQAVWKPQNPSLWKEVDARFTRDPEGRWEKKNLPSSWEIEVSGITFKLSPTDFGHLGIFPEQGKYWNEVTRRIKEADREVHFLNLFAYSGGMTLAAARAGAQVCHLDASKGMVDWAKENAALNGLEEAPIRWIVDDALKFVQREVRRGRKYDAIVLDPPTFGRGSKGQVFKIEEDLAPILEGCRELLTEDPLFIMLSCHTPGYTPTILSHILEQEFGGSIDCGELFLEGNEIFSLPSGVFALDKLNIQCSI